MKLVSAIIKPHKVKDVRAALAEIGVKGMTVAEVRGTGNQKGATESYRSATIQSDFNLREKIDVVVDDTVLDRVIDTIVAAARSGDLGQGRVGDGKIFVYNVAEAVRIRTNERGLDAVESLPTVLAGSKQAA
jgi:nitrogen regulatory protein PII